MPPFRTALVSLTIALCSIGALGPAAGAIEGAAAYAVAQQPNATACARTCRDDGLCMSWTFQDGACALSAVAPVDNDPAVVSGVSPRAPAFAAVAYDLRGASAPPDAAPPTTATTAAAAEGAAPALVLLGGPDGDQHP